MKVQMKDKMLVDYDGSAIADEKGLPMPLRKAIAMMLRQDTKEQDPVKVYELGRKFALDDEVDLDTSDLETVERIVKASGYIALVKGQVLLALKAK